MQCFTCALYFHVPDVLRMFFCSVYPWWWKCPRELTKIMSLRNRPTARADVSLNAVLLDWRLEVHEMSLRAGMSLKPEHELNEESRQWYLSGNSTGWWRTVTDGAQPIAVLIYILLIWTYTHTCTTYMHNLNKPASRLNKRSFQFSIRI